MFERYIAIDNVCAWPNLTLLPDGTILATIHNQPAHGTYEADTECWASDDEGRSWTLRGVACPHKPGENSGLNHGAGLAADGSMVVVTTGRCGVAKPGTIPAKSDPKNRKKRILPAFVCRSSDHGKSWQQTGSIGPLPGHEYPPIAFGPIQTLADGKLALPAHSDGNSYLLHSGDDGYNWSVRGTIAKDNFNETCFTVVKPGHLLAAARTYDDQHLEFYASEDDGITWQARGQATMPGQIPGNLRVLADGRILFTYGIRNLGLRGIGYRFGDADGAKWSRPGVLLDFGTITDGGYPSSVQLPDGTIVTAYYAGATPAHMRYHMGVLRWKPEDLAEVSVFGNSYASGSVWKDIRTPSLPPGHEL